MKKNFTIILAAFALILFGKTDLVRETKMDSVLASVNGEPVTLLDVLLETGNDEARLAVMFSGERLYNKTYELRKSVVNELIERKLIYQTFKARPFEIRKQDVEDMLDRLALSMANGTREGLTRKAKQMGINMRELQKKAEEKIAVDVLIYENCVRRVFVTPREVYTAYKNNPAQWSIPQSVSIKLIQIRKDSKSHPNLDELIKNLSQLLKDADDKLFSQVAAKNSDGPNTKNGGDMGWIELQYMRPEFVNALKNKKAGTVAGPVDTPEAWYFLRLSAIRQSEMQPFEKVAKQIENELKNMAVAKQRKLYLDDLKREAVIKYYW